MTELKIKHIKSSSYHPESRGALERFHQTLKSMLRKFCLETNKEWDEGLPLLLFAVRETPQESLGFSPCLVMQFVAPSIFLRKNGYLIKRNLNITCWIMSASLNSVLAMSVNWLVTISPEPKIKWKVGMIKRMCLERFSQVIKYWPYSHYLALVCSANILVRMC